LVDEDAEILAEFLVESHENLDQLDRDLVGLEADPESRDLLSSIFRTIHTIKGTSGFLALHRLESLTHVGETLLSRLRDGEMPMSTSIADALLTMVDTVRALLDAIETQGSDAASTTDVDSVVALLTDALEGRLPAAEPAGPAESAPQPEAPQAPALSAEEFVPTADALGLTLQPVASGQDLMVEDPEEVTGQPVPASTSTGDADVQESTDHTTGLSTEPGGDTSRLIDSSVRVDVELLDGLVQLVGELVLTRNQILQRTEGSGDTELVRAVQRLDLVASELQESVMKTRMQPIGQVWSKMPRVVRDLASQLGRRVNLEMEGHDTELDRSLLEALKGPLTHLVRNSLDHGIEPPEARAKAGKPAEGKLQLRAYHESGQVIVEISDDGKGIDPALIGQVAVSRGVLSSDALARMDSKEILDLIFRPGFSTASEVTNVSGRGVGMDVVRTNIERIGGSVDMVSTVGEGTTCRVRIPLTLAIIPALVVGEGEDRYAIPQANLVELVRLEGEDLSRSVEQIGESPVLRLRGHLLPLVQLGDVLGSGPSGSDALTVVVVQANDLRFGLCVEHVHDTQEIVVKPIGRQLKPVPLYAGATIMGDGRVSLILDVGGIAQAAGVELSATDAPADSQSTRSDDESALLVLEVSGGRRAALPLTAVSRLEEFPIEQVELSGQTEVVQYRDGILPLIRLAPAIGLSESASERETLSVIVHEENQARVGIIVDRVVDVVATELDKSQVGVRYGVLGSAVISDKVTDLVDLAAVVGIGAA
jgi:two-component system chemotaxis sensor kinase CheA